MLLAHSLTLLLASLVQGPPGAGPPLPVAIRQALPAGYTVLDATSGDLNRDAQPDWVVVLRRPDEQKTSDVVSHPTRRPLLLFVGGQGAPSLWLPVPTKPCIAWTAAA